MNSIFLFKELGVLKGNKTVLDVGARDGSISSRFIEMGMSVDAIDINEPEIKIEEVNFETISAGK